MLPLISPSPYADKAYLVELFNGKCQLSTALSLVMLISLSIYLAR